MVSSAAKRRRAARGLDRVPDRALEPGRVETALDQVVRGAALQGRGVEAAILLAGDHDHRGAVARLAIRPQEVDPAPGAEARVHEVGVVPPGGHRLESSLERPGPFELDETRQLGDEVAEPDTVLLAADEQDTEGPRPRRGRHGVRLGQQAVWRQPGPSRRVSGAKA
jgi:hypothetical protein